MSPFLFTCELYLEDCLWKGIGFGCMQPCYRHGLCFLICVFIRCAVLLFEVGSIGTPLGFRFQTQDGLMEHLPMQNLLYLFSEPVCHLLFRNSLQFPEPRRGFGYVKPLWDLVLRVHSHLWYLSLPLLWKILPYFYLHVIQMSIYY